MSVKRWLYLNVSRTIISDSTEKQFLLELQVIIRIAGKTWSFSKVVRENALTMLHVEGIRKFMCK